MGMTHLFTCYSYVGMSAFMLLTQKVDVFTFNSLARIKKTAKKKKKKKIYSKRETHQILSDLNSHTSEPRGSCLISSWFSKAAIFFRG